jgi:hypothetical protein
MNAQPTRRFNWHPASLVTASLIGMLVCGLNPTPIAAVDAPTVGWRSTSLKVSDNWNTLSFDVMVKRSRVTSTGTPVGTPSPTALYHIERSSRTGPWKTVVTVLGIDRTPLYSLSGQVGAPSPFPVARLEDDEDGTPVRAYDSQGHQLPLPPLSSPITNDAPLFPTRVTGKTWINSIVFTGANKSTRQLELERKYGKGTKVNGLLRYRKGDSVTMDEVIADAKINPVQNNIVKNSKRVVHREFTYAAAYTDAVVRTKQRAEVEVSPSSTDLAVIETIFGNIALERR